jgi:hypothetical protein
MNVRDTELKKTKALPNGAATIYTDGIDLGAITARGALLAQCELLISAPALVVGDLADTKTMKYDVQCDADSAFGSARTLALAVITQTGAGGAGAAAATARFRLPSDCERYLRVAATNDAAGDASDKSVTVELLF